MLQIRDKDGAEHDNKDEAIVPTDMNLICDDDLRLILNNMAQVHCPHMPGMHSLYLHLSSNFLSCNCAGFFCLSAVPSMQETT